MKARDEVEVREVVLDRLMAQTRRHVSPYVWRHLEAEVWVDDLSENLAVQLRSEVLAKTLAVESRTETVRWSTPTSPWQFFKDRHAGSWWLGWLVRRRPARFTTHHKEVTMTAKQIAVFPDSRVFFSPELGHPVVLEVVDQ